MKIRLASFTLVLCACGTQDGPSTDGPWRIVRDETLHTEVTLPSDLPAPPALAIDDTGRLVVAVAHADAETPRVDAMISDEANHWHHQGDVAGASAHVVATAGGTWLLAADSDGTPALYRMATESWELAQRFEGSLATGPAALAADGEGGLHALLAADDLVHFSSASAWAPQTLGTGRAPSLALGPGGELGAIAFDATLGVLQFVRPGAGAEPLVTYSDEIDPRDRLRARVAWGPSGPRVLAVRWSDAREVVLFEHHGGSTWSERVLFRDLPLPGTEGCAATAAGDVCPFTHLAHTVGAILPDGLMVIEEDLVHGQYVWTCNGTCSWELGPPRRIDGTLLLGDPDAGFSRVQPPAPFGGGELVAVRAGGSLHVAAYVYTGAPGVVALRYLELALDALPACTDECEPGTTSCTADSVAQCVRGENGCSAWQSVDACPEGSVCFDGTCQSLDEGPPPRSLWASCDTDEDCDSNVCFQYWGYVDTTWTLLGGLCSFFSNEHHPWEENPEPCAPGGAWYMPGCVSSFCLPACTTDADCRAELTCDRGVTWNPTVCGYWPP